MQVIGPVVDVSFEGEGNNLPDIYEALEITRDDGHKIIVEVQQHIGEHTVRAVSMDSTDGLQRGLDVVAKGAAITMPVGEDIKGRLFNVVGQAIDGIGEMDNTNGYEIHREPPKF